MTCSCEQSSSLDMDVKYSFTFVDSENLEHALKSIFETPERVIQDCEGVFKIESDEFCIEKPILARKRDDEYSFSDGYKDDEGMWKSLSSCILEEIKKLDKKDIRISLEFRVSECVTMKYR